MSGFQYAQFSFLALMIVTVLIMTFRYTPSVLQGGEPSDEYDRLINALIDADAFTIDGSHTIRAGKLRVWVSNFPTGYGHPYDSGVTEDLNIHPKTKRRLREYVERKAVVVAAQKAGETA